ncbi:hypothetical protein AOQ84DRAFT_361442 [Glonium stellatum]|uniref:Uncharacterized protein n=1 Tax=Glonium stellatum TaxID=574774 RepID=A0A8E2JWB1_9PEZI|nr:hypothetical protein AOQ84DRAFT_361442 [Glonium stellatum]
MSWMDSWSRPSKYAATPPPLYLLPGGQSTLYCHACGRVISPRRSNTKASVTSPVKYCSQRCQRHKPGKIDRHIEDVFVSLLNGSDLLSASTPTPKERKIKGDPRILVSCSAAEAIVFRDRHDSEDNFRHKRNEVKREIADPEERRSVDMEETIPIHLNETSDEHFAEDSLKSHSSIGGAGKVRPPQAVSEVNGSIGGEKGWAERTEETLEMVKRRKEGLRRVEEREMVRSAARRGCIFGFTVGAKDNEGKGTRRKCEAVMNGRVVEPSFAKGEWSIRWRQ